MLLDIAPVWTDVNLVCEGQLDQIFERAFQRLSGDMKRPGVIGSIDDQAHAVVADDVLGWRSDHPDLALRHNRCWTILWERALIEPVRHRRPRSPIVFVPVVFRGVSVGTALVQANR